MSRFLPFIILSFALTGNAPAQQPAPPSATSGASSPGANAAAISPTEWQQLRAARNTALQNNPDLMAANKKLIEKMQAFEVKLDAAIVKANPTIAPIIAKFDAARHRVDAPNGVPPQPSAPAK